MPCLTLSSPWCLLVSPGVSWCVLVSRGVSWCLLVSPGVSWWKRVSFLTLSTLSFINDLHLYVLVFWYAYFQ